ncbi:MAG: glutathione S-transferase [Myxococcales bacterium]|nr:glutathione S-transferase [Myxococcales bacterium]
MIVHHLDNSRSQRVLWLLEELGLDYEIRQYQRDPKTLRAPDSLREVHPLGRAPVVTWDGIVLAESGAVIETVLDWVGDAAGALRPEVGTDAFRQFRYWLHYAEGSLMPPLLVRLITQRMRHAPVPFFLKPMLRSIAGRMDAGYAGPELKRHIAHIEAHLGAQPWFAGDSFSAADIMMSYPLEAGTARGAAGDAQPKIADWLARIRARPAYAKALERGGPFTLL